MWVRTVVWTPATGLQISQQRSQLRLKGRDLVATLGLTEKLRGKTSENLQIRAPPKIWTRMYILVGISHVHQN